MRVLGYAACRTAAAGVSDEYFLKVENLRGSRMIIVVAGCTLHKESGRPPLGRRVPAVEDRLAASKFQVAQCDAWFAARPPIVKVGGAR